VAAFGAAGGAGRALQAHLEAWAAAHPETSYISAMWYDMYLASREPLLLNMNPQLTWLDAPARGRNPHLTASNQTRLSSAAPQPASSNPPTTPGPWAGPWS
jgi:hypothetical protein